MLLWIGFAILTAAVVAALLRPLLRAGAGSVAPAAANVAVYRDQLAEIDADRERGLIGAAEAASARAEVARRLIAVSDGAAAVETVAVADGASAATANAWARKVIAGAVPILAVLLYVALGSPGLPGRPYSKPDARPLAAATEGELIAMVEQRLRDKPEDGRGWDVIAPAYLNQGRWAEAADAFGRAAKLLGDTPKRLHGFAEASIIANNGLVTEPARKAFERLLELEPGNGEAQFGLALAKEQDGKLAEAASEYRRILDAAPADARWRPAVEVRLAKLLRGGGPSDVESAAALGMSKEERDKFIGGMVERLAARLREKPADLAGWQQLVRSYKVLGREGDAKAALESARDQFRGDAKAEGELDVLAKSMGLMKQ